MVWPNRPSILIQETAIVKEEVRARQAANGASIPRTPTVKTRRIEVEAA